MGTITFYNGRYYVSSSGGGNKILVVFDSKGKYLLKIDNRGQGPGEYREVTDYTITKNSDILIYSTLEKIVKYDSLGNYINEQRYKYLVNGVSKKVNNKIFVFKKLGGKSEDRDLLTINDISLTAGKDFFPVSDSEVRRMRGQRNFNNFSVDRDNVYFNYPFCDTIFNVTSSERKAAYYVDFGNKKLPSNIFGDEIDIIYKTKMIKKNGGVDGISGFNVSADFLYLCFSDFKDTEYLSLYNLKTKKTLTACKILDDIYFKGFLYNSEECRIPRSYDGEDLLWSLDPQILIRAYEDYKQRASKEEWAKFVSSNAKLVSVCSALKEDDNPVIVRLNLK